MNRSNFFQRIAAASKPVESFADRRWSIKNVSELENLREENFWRWNNPHL